MGRVGLATRTAVLLVLSYKYHDGVHEPGRWNLKECSVNFPQIRICGPCDQSLDFEIDYYRDPATCCQRQRRAPFTSLSSSAASSLAGQNMSLRK